MHAVICGVGTAVPRQVITQARTAELMGPLLPGTRRQQQLLPAVYQHVGVETRHSVLLSDDQPYEVQQSFYRRAPPEAGRGPTTAERMDVYEVEAGRLAEEASRAALTENAIEARAI